MELQSNHNTVNSIITILHNVRQLQSKKKAKKVYIHYFILWSQIRYKLTAVSTHQ